MYLKPARGLIVRDPHTRQPLPAEGREVQLTEWWMRRLRAGDAIEVARSEESTLEDSYHSDSDEVKP